MGLTAKKAGHLQRRNLLKKITTTEELLKLCYLFITAEAQSGYLYARVPKIRTIAPEVITETIKVLTADGFRVIDQDEAISIGW